jgi:endoglucanase
VVAGGTLLVLVALVTLVGGLGVLLPPGDSGPGDSGDRPTDQDAVEAARRFLDRYVGPDGRVARHDQGGDTVSEGQGYALLLAVAIEDEDRFRTIWRWTHDELQRPDGLFAWSWRQGAVRDDMPAADADVEIAWALVLAAERFDDPDLRLQGVDVAAAVLDHQVERVGEELVLAAGPWATGDPLVLNPSYLIPAAFRALHAASGDDRWDLLDRSAGSLLATLTEDGSRLPPDWGEVRSDGVPRPTSASGGSGAAQYGLDAARVPIRLASSCRDEDRDLAAALWDPIQRLGGGPLVLAHSLDGRALTDGRSSLGAIAAADAAGAAGDQDEAARLLRDAAGHAEEVPTYYGDAWLALGTLLLTTDLLVSCP